MKKMRPSRKKDAFFEAALKSISKVGVSRMNAASVTKLMKIPTSNFFYYFETQEIFLEELVGYLVQTHTQAISSLQEPDSDRSFWQRLEGFCIGNLQTLADHPENADLIFFGTLSCGGDQKIRQLITNALASGEEKVFNILAGGFAIGEFEFKLPVKTTAFLLHKAYLGAGAHINQSVDRQKACAEAIQRALDLSWLLVKSNGTRPTKE